LYIRKYASSFTSTTLSTDDSQYLSYLNKTISSISKPFSILLKNTISWQLRTDLTNNSKNETFIAVVVKTHGGDIIGIKNISNGNITTVLNESGSEPAISYANEMYYLAYVKNETIIIKQYNESMRETGKSTSIQNENASSPSITIKDNLIYVVYLSNKSGTMNVYMNKYNMSLNLNESINITNFVNIFYVNPMPFIKPQINNEENYVIFEILSNKRISSEKTEKITIDGKELEFVIKEGVVNIKMALWKTNSSYEIKEANNITKNINFVEINAPFYANYSEEYLYNSFLNKKQKILKKIISTSYGIDLNDIISFNYPLTITKTNEIYYLTHTQGSNVKFMKFNSTSGTSEIFNVATSGSHPTIYYYYKNGVYVAYEANNKCVVVKYDENGVFKTSITSHLNAYRPSITSINNNIFMTYFVQGGEIKVTKCDVNLTNCLDIKTIQTNLTDVNTIDVPPQLVYKNNYFYVIYQSHPNTTNATTTQKLIESNYQNGPITFTEITTVKDITSIAERYTSLWEDSSTGEDLLKSVELNLEVTTYGEAKIDNNESYYKNKEELSQTYGVCWINNPTDNNFMYSTTVRDYFRYNLLSPYMNVTTSITNISKITITDYSKKTVTLENITTNENVTCIAIGTVQQCSIRLSQLSKFKGDDITKNKHSNIYLIKAKIENATTNEEFLGTMTIGDNIPPTVDSASLIIRNYVTGSETLNIGDAAYVALNANDSNIEFVRMFVFANCTYYNNDTNTNVIISGWDINDQCKECHQIKSTLLLNDKDMNKRFDNLLAPFFVPDKINDKYNITSCNITFQFAVWDMCCNVYSSVLGPDAKYFEKTLFNLVRPLPPAVASSGGGGGGSGGISVIKHGEPSEPSPLNITELVPSILVRNYTLKVFNLTPMEEGRQFIVKVINETYTYNITYKKINTTNGTRWVEVNTSLVSKIEIPVSNANVEYAGQTAVTGIDGTTVIPKAIVGVIDIRATKGSTEARMLTVVETKKPTTVEKEILIITLLKVKGKEKEEMYEFEVRDKQGNLAANRELVVKLPNNAIQKIVTDEYGRFSLTINQSGYITVDQQEYANYTVEHFALPVEIKKKAHDYWILFLLLLPILLLIYLILFMMKGKVEITKERSNGKVSITITNKTHKTLNACMLEDIIPLGLQIEVITQGLEKTAMGDTLIMNLGNLKKGEKRIAEYKIINAEGIKGTGAKGLPEAKVVWSNGEQRSKNI
ncbi:MAG: hypothetical protein QMD06_01900, partial [Candidatus Altarchaeum sp.]|nr:hypothetical protein [Candidatus Altarchaeum sp.]